MSKRVGNPRAARHDYVARLREYFGFHLFGLDFYESGGELQVQIEYMDFKHIDTVRRELAQMMPDVEFTKIKRSFTDTAAVWALRQMMEDDQLHPEPTIYVKKEDDSLVLSSLWEIAFTELRQLELDEDDNIPYNDYDRKIRTEQELYSGIDGV